MPGDEAKVSIFTIGTRSSSSSRSKKRVDCHQIFNDNPGGGHLLRESLIPSTAVLLRSCIPSSLICCTSEGDKILMQRTQPTNRGGHRISNYLGLE